MTTEAPPVYTVVKVESHPMRVGSHEKKGWTVLVPNTADGARMDAWRQHMNVCLAAEIHLSQVSKDSEDGVYLTNSIRACIAFFETVARVPGTVVVVLMMCDGLRSDTMVTLGSETLSPAYGTTTDAVRDILEYVEYALLQMFDVYGLPEDCAHFARTRSPSSPPCVHNVFVVDWT
jgi:hypothetical protein